MFLSATVVYAEDTDNHTNTEFSENEDSANNIIQNNKVDTNPKETYETIEYNDDYYNTDFSFESLEEFEIEGMENDSYPINTTSESSIKNINKVNSNSIIFTQQQIGLAANQTYTYIAENRLIPSFATVGSTRVNMNDFLYVLCKSLNNTNEITFNSYNHVQSTSGTNKPNYIMTRNEYVSLSGSIVDCYEINGRNPKSISYKNMTISFDDAVYFYSRIAAYKDRTNSLIGNIRVLALYNKDYSTETRALYSTSTNPFTVTAQSSKNNNGTYTLKLTASQTSTIYYTINGTIPTTNSYKYTGSLIISNNTWVRYFAVNNKNEQTPVLSFGVYRASIPYVTSKSILTNNNFENKINISTSEPSIIYYSLNGTKPSIQSPQYTGTLTINNNTLVQFFSITTSNNKRSATYYYKLQNPTPYVTILNTTEVQDNHQNVTIIANKPGTIYYTRNGSTPTRNDKIYTSGTILDLSVKTQLRAILVDEDGKSSNVVFYQAPQIITPPITVIKPITTLNTNNNQQIQFITNNENSTIYYTTDGSNPRNSSTIKTAKPNSKITIKKTTYLNYYTKDTEGYTSANYLYRTPQFTEERPEITVYNTTGIYADGTQRIMIQSNQPVTFNITYFSESNIEKFNKNIGEEFTVTENSTIHIITKYNDNYSKTIEYNPLTGMQTVMNFNYTVTLHNTNQYNSIFFIEGGEIYTFTMNDNALSKYIHINLDTYQVNIQNSEPLGKSGVTIHKKSNNDIEIKFFSIAYGETNVINSVICAPFNYYENLCVYSNGKRLFDIFWTKNNKNNEVISTEFKTLSNTFSKEETLTYSQRPTSICGNYDILQTYLLTNIKITDEFYNQSLYNLRTYNPGLDIGRITPQDRTILTGLTTLREFDGYADYFANALNTITYRNKETLCIIGINYDRVNYIQFSDLKMGMYINTDITNEINFNLHISIALPEIARTSLNLIKENIGKTAQTLLMELDENSITSVYINNQTGILKMYSSDLENVYLLFNSTSGLLYSIIILDGFEYNGAISDPIIQEENEQTNENILNNIRKSSTLIPCFEDYLNSGVQSQAMSIFGMACDSNLGIFENIIGSTILGIGIGMFAGVTSAVIMPTIIPALIITGGFLLLADSHGILTGTASYSDYLSFGIDLALTGLSVKMTSSIAGVAKKAFSSIPNGQKTIISATEAVYEYKMLSAIKNTSQTCIDTVRDQIISKEVKDEINYITGWGVS